jgi:tetraacyldisaccharide 4'-kinase
MHEPAFWHRPSSWLSRLLTPLSALYGAVADWRLAMPGIDAGVPVFCVGNYHSGGAGKTPTTLALVALLRDLGETPVVLSRGYGGRLRGPVSVDPVTHTAADVGDEPLMMARIVPVVVAKDRVAGAALAASRGASVIVMDDGFQSPSIVKHAALIVIDAARGIGNGRVIPSGPLRAPLASQLLRTDALIIVGDGTAADPVGSAIEAKGGMVLRAQLKPDDASVDALRGRRVLAFAGIGDPARFFATLRGSGIEVVAEKAFPDHHPFAQADIDALIDMSRDNALTLVTTEKDFVRLRNTPGLASFARQVTVFAVTLHVDAIDQLRGFVVAKLNAARAPKRAGGD